MANGKIHGVKQIVPVLLWGKIEPVLPIRAHSSCDGPCIGIVKVLKYRRQILGLLTDAWLESGQVVSKPLRCIDHQFICNFSGPILRS